MNSKKLIKLISCLIPNKNLRHKFRESYDKKQLEKIIYSIEYGKAKKELERIEKEFPNVMTIEETINKILNEKKSVARYGDGEFNLLIESKKAQNIFQIKNEDLKRRLIEILRNKNEKILICISPFKSTKRNSSLKRETYFMERYWLYRWKELKSFFNIETLYGNSFISRINLFQEISIDKIVKIWQDRKIVFVYSKEGRFNRDSRLFGNVEEFNEIFIPATNAFEKYEEILNKCKNYSKDTLFLIAAGPTATVLAYDLSLEGYQAIDIGHFPNCYQEYLGEIKSPEALPINKESER